MTRLSTLNPLFHIFSRLHICTMRSCIEEAAQARLETELAADSASNTNHYTARKHYKWRKKICTEPGNERSLEKKKFCEHTLLFFGELGLVVLLFGLFCRQHTEKCSRLSCMKALSNIQFCIGRS